MSDTSLTSSVFGDSGPSSMKCETEYALSIQRKRRKVNRQEPISEQKHETANEPPDIKVQGDPDQYNIKVEDNVGVLNYYTQSWSYLLLPHCRRLAKVLIATIEPDKPLDHPYSGGKAKDPEATKPNWWPVSVVHKQPDHLNKSSEILPQVALRSSLTSFLRIILLLNHLISTALPKTLEQAVSEYIEYVKPDWEKTELKDHPGMEYESRARLLKEVLKVHKTQVKFDDGNLSK